MLTLVHKSKFKGSNFDKELTHTIEEVVDQPICNTDLNLDELTVGSVIATACDVGNNIVHPPCWWYIYPHLQLHAANWSENFISTVGHSAIFNNSFCIINHNFHNNNVFVCLFVSGDWLV
ncbi:hypothetical protein C0J52_26936 [Blattella germanica]|nr:hypothetical protein C0J52_26936 [Blattella germanica]